MTSYFNFKITPEDCEQKGDITTKLIRLTLFA